MDDTKLLLSFKVGDADEAKDTIHYFKLSLLGKELLPSESIKDLGVTFDPTLSFDNHILATVSSCMSKLAQI